MKVAHAILMLLLQAWPACPAEGWVTSGYGHRIHPLTHRRSFHEGIDIANIEGTPLRAPWAAVVSDIRRTGRAGLHVVLRTGPFPVKMAHLSSVLVVEGQRLKRGEKVGRMGHSGRVTGDHVHLELRRWNRRCDPSLLLASCRPRPR